MVESTAPPLRARVWVHVALAALGAAMLALIASAPSPGQSANRVYVTEVSGAIGVATTRQLERAIEKARADQAAALVLRLDTPGGLVSATRELIKQMIASPVPVVVYVGPSGAQAASAGTFIVYASHLAAMAPGTNLGAATPVEIGGLPGLPQPQRQPGKDDKPAQPQQTTAQTKAINDVVALLRSLAQLRGRDAEFAEKAVREAATLTAQEAHKQGVVEAVAVSMQDLLGQIDGRKVSVAGADRILATKDAEIVTLEPDFRTRLLSVISNPNVAFLLLMVGFYGLILEFWNPGTLVAGVIGGISLILALIALSALPVNYGALGLMVLGIALMIGEAFTPGIGVLGIGGVLAFGVGAYFLFEGAGSDIEIAVSLPLILGTTVTTALLVFGVVAAALQARRRPPVMGGERLIGETGQIVDWQDDSGHVRTEGEIWAARGTGPLKAGAIVRIVRRDGLTLYVET